MRPLTKEEERIIEINRRLEATHSTCVCGSIDELFIVEELKAEKKSLVELIIQENLKRTTV